MSLRNTIFLFEIMLLCCSYFAMAVCPHANQLYNVVANSDQLIYDYESPISYDTYETDCHRFVSQPPQITNTLIDHALRQAVDRTDQYISLDDHAAAGARLPKLIADMDRSNYYFESATKYLQETTCASKSTTTTSFEAVDLGQFKSFLTENVTRAVCENGHIKFPSCSRKSTYRRADGMCNNFKNPVIGRAGDCMLRLLKPDYKDGISALRTSIDGSALPNARVLSTSLFGGDSERPLSRIYTELQVNIGEFVIIDNGLTLSPNAGMLINLQCCDHGNLSRVDHPHCAPIPIAPSDGDALHQQYPNQNCMQFTRSFPCARCELGPRLLSSSSTAAQDLNSVYGVSRSMLIARRTMSGGRLKSQYVNGHELYAVDRFNSSGRFRCFEGNCEIAPIDARNLLLPTGQSLALLFHRNHNRHARQIAKIKPKWSDEKVFQEARKWNIAEYQHIIYNEYIHTVIGTELANFFDLLPNAPGVFSEYVPDKPLRTIIEFQTTAGRQGHAALNEEITIFDRKNRRKLQFYLRQSELWERIFYDGHLDGFLLAQMSRQSFETTPSIPFKTFLLNVPGRTFGLDLAALDIQRQRDHGIPGYVRYLKYLHNVDVECWEDFVQFIDMKNIEKLKAHYKYVEDVELYVAGRYERKLSDALVGPTFAKIIGIQFQNVKYGDRFFYEHGNQIGSFKMEQLNEIKTKTSLARILCKNLDFDQVLPKPLQLPSYANLFVPCKLFKDLDYKLL